ncbi:MAG: hypothetical protein LQ350_003923 [Teloschistes chrysophthalmus]|nr:MAG: hypothetical protein LQ350_003923 [Niorma chrysophthalma]
MATFLTDLFTSIFTPGPTPSLLLATNGSFAALQIVLLVLLILTYSVHFIVLSGLCAGLWWSINWFAVELEIAKKEAKEREAKQIEQASRQRHGSSPDDSDTETEGSRDTDPAVPPAPKSNTALLPDAGEGDLRKRRSLGSSTGELSTDSEWDKVEEADTQK